MLFGDAMKMAAYWAIEPPISLLYLRVNFRKDDGQEDDGTIQPVMQGMPYWRLSEGLKCTVRRQWLKRNPGKTEADFFAALKKKTEGKYSDKLEAARKKKQNG